MASENISENVSTENTKPIRNRRNLFQVEVWNPQSQTWTWTSDMKGDYANNAARKSFKKLKKYPHLKDDLNEYRVRVTRADPYRVTQQKIGDQEAWPSRKAIGLSRVPQSRTIPPSDQAIFDSQSQQNGTAGPDQDSALGH